MVGWLDAAGCGQREKGYDNAGTELTATYYGSGRAEKQWWGTRYRVKGKMASRSVVTQTSCGQPVPQPMKQVTGCNLAALGRAAHGCYTA